MERIYNKSFARGRWSCFRLFPPVPHPLASLARPARPSLSKSDRFGLYLKMPAGPGETLLTTLYGQHSTNPPDSRLSRSQVRRHPLLLLRPGLEAASPPVRPGQLRLPLPESHPGLRQTRGRQQCWHARARCLCWPPHQYCEPELLTQPAYAILAKRLGRERSGPLTVASTQSQREERAEIPLQNPHPRSISLDRERCASVVESSQELVAPRKLGHQRCACEQNAAGC